MPTRRHGRALQGGGYQNAQQLLAAPHGDVVPDLVVEVLSPSETQSAVDAKIEDYRQVGVRELWLVSPEAETGEVLKLSSEGAERVGLYGRGDVVPRTYCQNYT
ncbi:MAG: Uma2 family endonuclease [Armatimonadota bacterium]